MMTMLYEVLKTAKMGAWKAPDLYTALLANNLRRDGEVKTLSGIPPLTFTSNGTPLLDLLISGNEEHSGTPFPDNPIMPQGTGERTGNLCATENFANSTTDTRSFLQLAIMCYYGSDFVGRATFSGGTQLLDIKTTGNKQILFTVTAENCNRLFIKHNGATRDISISNVYGAFSGDYNISFDCNGTNPTVVDGVSLENIMLNTGSTAISFEPYGYKIPISSASTTTPVYLGEVETTRRVKKLVLDGTEGWLMNADGWFYITSVSDDYLRSEGNITSMCSHYPTYKQSSAIAQLPEGYTGFSWGSVQRLYLKDTAHRNDLSSFEQWVAAQYAAGTPVTVWYVLATETTGIVNEPLMKIGDYADTLSKAQAGVEIPTNNGSTTVDVETAVKPSEVYIKYKS